MIADFAVCPFTVQPLRAGIPRGHVRYTGTYASPFVHVYMCYYVIKHTFIHAYIHANTHIYMHTQSHTYIRTHTHNQQLSHTFISTPLLISSPLLSTSFPTSPFLFSPLTFNQFATAFSVPGDHSGRGDVGLLGRSGRHGILHGKRNIYRFARISGTCTFW